MDTCVMLVSNTVREDHNPHLSRKYQKEDKTDIWLSMISSFDSVVAVYVGLPCKISHSNLSLNNQCNAFCG